MNKKLSVAVLLALACLSGCKSQFDILLEGNDQEKKYKTAFEYFNQGKYNKAATLFESLGSMSGVSERDDTVQYYWGLSNYNNHDYYTAETNFEHFISNFPRSPFTESAQFLRIDCLYKSTLRYELDQAPTYKAMAAISEYMINNTGGANNERCIAMLNDLGERLDRKAFEGARLYYKMEDYKASRVAFKNILKDDSENIYREQILYYSAMSSYKYADMSISAKQKERFLVFVDDYLNFIGEYPESEYRKELDKLYERVKNKN